MKRHFTAIVAATCMTTAVSAEGLSYARIDADLNHIDFDSLDVTTTYLNGAVEYITGQFLLSADLIGGTARFDGDSSNFFIIDVGAAYMATPDLLFGAGVTNTGDNDTDSFTGYDVIAQYQTDVFALGLGVAQENEFGDRIETTLFGEYAATPGLNLGAEISQETDSENTFYTLSADYQTGPIELRGAYSGFTATSASIGVLSARGSYEITPDVRALAAFQTTTGDTGGFDFETYSVGAGYQYRDGIWIDASYGKFDAFGGPEVNRLEIGISFETGEQLRIDHRFAAAQEADSRSGIGALSF